jgi:hypothetical protein
MRQQSGVSSQQRLTVIGGTNQNTIVVVRCNELNPRDR